MENYDSCVFCSISAERIILQNAYFFVTPDKHPVLPGHLLIISRRHTPNIFTLTQDEFCALHELLQQVRQYLEQKHQPDGYNIGTNTGRAAGQSIPHFHLHIIPRYNNPPGKAADQQGIHKLREYHIS